MKYYLLGVDAGFRFTGLSLFQIKKKGLKFVNCTVIQTKKAGKKKNVRVADDDVQGCMKIVKDINTFLSDNTSGARIIAGVEYPHGGGQGARPHRLMGLVTGTLVTCFVLLNITVEHVTPDEVKMAVIGRSTATKKQIMKKIAKLLKAEISKRHVRTKTGVRQDITYVIKGNKYGANFEHIADSVGAAYHTMKYSEYFKMLREQVK